ncbi:MAG TPA: hypothetical protein PLD23_15985 [Armatimonadota bacterium]|nr:hypothetical protein [Armatimonadota bacterium]HQK95010.1 hypothetical protein [Armatimonadota bacterium]
MRGRRCTSFAEVPLTLLRANQRRATKALGLEKRPTETIRVSEDAFTGMLGNGA